MASTNNSSLGHGADGTQTTLEEQSYPAQAASNESIETPPKYTPSIPHHQSMDLEAGAVRIL